MNEKKIQILINNIFYVIHLKCLPRNISVIWENAKQILECSNKRIVNITKI